jgi:hypothetical protein
MIYKDPKKAKKKGFGSKKSTPNDNNANNNNANNNNVNITNNNHNNKININNNINNNNINNNNNNNDNDNNNKYDNNNDNTTGNAGVPTPRRKDPPISHKRLPKDPSTKIPMDTHVKWVIDSKNIDRQMLLLEQDLEISNKRKDQWGKELKSSCISPRNNNTNSYNNFGTRVRKDPHTSGPILFNKSHHNEHGIHNQKWNKDTELIDKDHRAKPQNKPDKGHESFQNLQHQIKNNSGNKNSSNSIQIMRNTSLIIRSESAIFD